MSNQHPVFECPQCGQPVEGKADYIARGLNCPSCSRGFIPVEVKTRDRNADRPFLPGWVWAIVGAVLVGLALMATRAMPIWAGLALAGLAVLVGIFVRMGRIERRL